VRIRWFIKGVKRETSSGWNSLREARSLIHIITLMPEIPRDYRGIGYMVTVLVDGAVDNTEPIFEYMADAEDLADSLMIELESECLKTSKWEIFISEVCVCEDSIEGSQYQTDDGSYAEGFGKL